MKPSDLFENIASVAPEFSAVVDEHLNDNGELLPHVLMSDLRRHVGERLLTHEPDHLVEVKGIMGLLEAGFTSGNPDTENAIAVSFIEYMETEDFHICLEPLLGPAMRAEHQRQMGWRDAD